MSELKCSGAERRVTRQMTATQLDSRNPLHIPEMLENILGFLSVEDLKTCRLVNKFWKESSLKPMREKCGMITFGRTIPVHEWKYGLEHMQKFLNSFRRDGVSDLLSEVRDDIPCTKFEIFTNIIDEQNSDREKLIVANFFQAISPWVTDIALQGGRDIGKLLNEIGKLMFPSLKRIRFADRHITIGTRSCAFSPWMSVFIQNSPQLKKIIFWSFIGFRDWNLNYEDTSSKQFVQVLGETRDLNLKTLVISAHLEDDDLIWLSKSDLKLKHLKLWIRKFPQPRISFQDLETLEIWHRESPANEDLHFPIMENMKSLTLMYNNCPGLINYAAQTSCLETVTFDMGIDWKACLNREMEPAPAVKELRFPRIDPTTETLLEAVRIFPNISKLQMVVYQRQHQVPDVPLQIVYDSLPNLEELTLNLKGFNSCIDGLLTGLSEKGCQNALRRLSHWTPKFDNRSIQIGIKHSPISVLKNLKLLRLRNESTLPRKLEISKVSLCLALMNMPSLQILDLCERSEAPDEVIPKTVLKEFRKNRLILWKPNAAGER